jgi:hypothetical protein
MANSSPKRFVWPMGFIANIHVLFMDLKRPLQQKRFITLLGRRVQGIILKQHSVYCSVKAIAFPIHTMKLALIANMVSTCLILHNMGVLDRFMVNANVAYIASTYSEPEHSVDTLDATVVAVGIDPNMLVSRF